MKEKTERDEEKKTCQSAGSHGDGLGGGQICAMAGGRGLDGDERRWGEGRSCGVGLEEGRIRDGWPPSPMAAATGAGSAAAGRPPPWMAHGGDRKSVV